MDILEALQKFLGDDSLICTEGTKEDPLFKTKDICKVFDIPNILANIRHFDNTERQTLHIQTKNGDKDCIFLTGKGMLKLLNSTKKPKIIKFKNYYENYISENDGNYISENDEDYNLIEDPYLNNLKIHKIISLQGINYNVNILDFFDKHVLYLLHIGNYIDPNTEILYKIYKFGYSSDIKQRIQTHKSNLEENLVPIKCWNSKHLEIAKKVENKIKHYIKANHINCIFKNEVEIIKTNDIELIISLIDDWIEESINELTISIYEKNIDTKLEKVKKQYNLINNIDAKFEKVKKQYNLINKIILQNIKLTKQIKQCYLLNKQIFIENNKNIGASLDNTENNNTEYLINDTEVSLVDIETSFDEDIAISLNDEISFDEDIKVSLDNIDEDLKEQFKNPPVIKPKESKNIENGIICSRCGLQPLENFSKNKATKQYYSSCNKCREIESEKRLKKNKEKNEETEQKFQEKMKKIKEKREELLNDDKTYICFKCKIEKTVEEFGICKRYNSIFKTCEVCRDKIEKNKNKSQESEDKSQDLENESQNSKDNESQNTEDNESQNSKDNESIRECTKCSKVIDINEINPKTKKQYKTCKKCRDKYTLIHKKNKLMINNTNITTMECQICHKDFPKELTVKKTAYYKRCLNCRKKIKKYDALKDPEKVSIQKREYYAKNKEKIREDQKNYYDKNNQKSSNLDNIQSDNQSLSDEDTLIKKQ
jgi:hypothetical protein